MGKEWKERVSNENKSAKGKKDDKKEANNEREVGLTEIHWPGGVK